MTRVADGFDAFFEQEYEPLFRAMFLVTGSRHEAEDVAQEAMTRAFERWELVASARSPSAYLYTIALNLHRSRIRRLVRSLGAQIHPPGVHDPAEVVQTRDDIVRALMSLPATQREALVLVEWLGLTADEAGDVLGIEAVSVRARLHRARTALAGRAGGDDG